MGPFGGEGTLGLWSWSGVHARLTRPIDHLDLHPAGAAAAASFIAAMRLRSSGGGFYLMRDCCRRLSTTAVVLLGAEKRLRDCTFVAGSLRAARICSMGLCAAFDVDNQRAGWSQWLGRFGGRDTCTKQCPAIVVEAWGGSGGSLQGTFQHYAVWNSHMDPRRYR